MAGRVIRTGRNQTTPGVIPKERSFPRLRNLWPGQPRRLPRERREHCTARPVRRTAAGTRRACVPHCVRNDILIGKFLKARPDATACDALADLIGPRCLSL